MIHPESFRLIARGLKHMHFRARLQASRFHIGLECLQYLIIDKENEALVVPQPRQKPCGQSKSVVDDAMATRATMAEIGQVEAEPELHSSPLGSGTPDDWRVLWVSERPVEGARELRR